MNEGDDWHGRSPARLGYADIALQRLIAIWRCGEAARHDPVLLNMQARIAGELGRTSPGAIMEGRALFERLTTESVGVEGSRAAYRG